MNRYLLFAAILVVLLVGCSAPPTPTPVPTLPPPTATVPPQQAYLAGAQKEGAFKLYTSLNDAEAKPLVEKFGQKYPFLKTEYFRASSGDVLTKLLAEAKAGTPPPDAIEVDGVDMLTMYNEKLLTAYKSPEAESFPDGAKHPWGYYTTCYVNGIVISYNTKLVKADEAPKSLNDLLNAKWSGKIGIEAADWALMPFSARVMGDQASGSFWTKLADQKPKVISGHTEVANAVAKGDVLVSPTTYEHRIEALKKSGQPVEWVKTDPVYAYLNSVAITAKAPHPNAAHLFVDWVLSAEGQTAVAGIGRIPIRPGIKADPITMTDGVKFYYGDPMLVADVNQSKSQYEKLFPIKQ